MDVKVTIVETHQTIKEYYVSGVNSLEMAAKCAKRCYNHEYQPNTYLYHNVPMPTTYVVDKYEVIDKS